MGRAMILALRQIFGTRNVLRHIELEVRSHSVALLPWWMINSGCMLSVSGALFGFKCFIAALISSVVNVLERLRSTLGDVRSSLTNDVVSLVKVLSASENLPFLQKIIQ